MTYFDKFKSIDWGLVFALCSLTLIGFLALVSVADGNLNPWALNHIIRFVLALILMIVIAIVDIRIWYKLSSVFFVGSFLLLVLVEVMGHVGMGAQRWIDLKVFKLQPSELMKISLILVLAKFYSRLSYYRISRLPAMTALMVILLVPSYLVFRQPDLGTAILMIMGGLCVAFLAGVSWKWFVSGAVVILVSLPFLWTVVLRPYQQKRVLTFLDPESDPLGRGYHIMQSKIAIGSGGITGRGFINGTQNQLGFLPEKHTDFIFTVIAEELGFIGAISVLALVLFILIKIFIIAENVRSYFAKLVVMGMGTTFFLYILINVGMVMGLFPVAGVPFPLVSYGGTVMITIMVAFGFIQNMWVHKFIEAPHSDIERI